MRPDLDPNSLTLIVFLKDYFLKKVLFLKMESADDKKAQITQNAKSS